MTIAEERKNCSGFRAILRAVSLGEEASVRRRSYELAFLEGSPAPRDAREAFLLAHRDSVVSHAGRELCLW